jgi:hypothetical protein
MLLGHANRQEHGPFRRMEEFLRNWPQEMERYAALPLRRNQRGEEGEEMKSRKQQPFKAGND